MELKGSLKFLLLLILGEFCFSFTLLSPTNMQSRNIVLYDNINSIMSASSFPVAFNRSFSSIPSICYGLNDDATIDEFRNQNIFTNITSIRLNSFTITVMLGLSSEITKLSINYLAIVQQPNIIILWNFFTNPLTSQRSRTSIVIQKSYNFSSTNVKGIHFLTGFFITSTTQYGISVYLVGIAQTHYQFNISTISDCSIHRIDISFFFYYPNDLTKNYSINCDLSTFSYSNINQMSQTETIENIRQSVFILALGAFSGITSHRMITFGWYIESSTSDTITITINTTNFINLNYTFIQISTYNFQSTSSSSSPSSSASNQMPLSTLLVIILVPIIAVLAIIIITTICCWRRYIRKYEKQLSKESITQLPSLAF